MEDDEQKQKQPPDGGAADGNSGVPPEEEAFQKPVRNFKITLPDEEPPEDGSAQEPQPAVAPAPGGDEPRRRGVPRVVRTVFYIIFVLLAAFALAGTFLFALSDYVGMFRPEHPAVQVTIPAKATPKEISEILLQDGVIRFPKAFELYAKYTHKAAALRPGMYTLNSDMSYQAIVAALRSTAARVVVKVTIPEGYTLQQIGAVLEQDGVCKQSDFLDAADSSSVQFDYSAQIPDNPERFYRLEGYLFPDTYQFYKGDSGTTVVKKMLADFDTRFTPAMRKQAAAQGMTADQAVTLASIIQKEAGKVSEMSKVSSVFHNRLKNGIGGSRLLQSDATIFYVTKDIQPVLSTTDTQLTSAYNTYKNEGLPPGAICNPGLDALNAALSPANTDYYFFVSDKAGKYYYAATYKQHLANVKKALRSGKAGGTNVVQ